MLIAALIPAFNPGVQLVDLAAALAASEFCAVFVVDDGSRESCGPIFAALEKLDKVRVLRHAENRGKGGALKTGLGHIYRTTVYIEGVVIVDADGQHLAEDAGLVSAALKEHPQSLVLGVRSFGGNVPLRSRVGNRLTGFLFGVLTGTQLGDTQTGLRGIPRSFVPLLLRIDANGYEFELDMLMACKQTGRPIFQQAIQTVYLANNDSSHFNPIVDSMKIYFVLFRFTLTSLLSAFIDNVVFVAVYHATASIALGQLSARLLATGFNYFAVSRRVFYCQQNAARTLPRYLALVCFSGVVSYFLIGILIKVSPLSVIVAKICAESIVFLANFAIQRDFIFVDRDSRSDREPSAYRV